MLHTSMNSFKFSKEKTKITDETIDFVFSVISFFPCLLCKEKKRKEKVEFEYIAIMIV